MIVVYRLRSVKYKMVLYLKKSKVCSVIYDCFVFRCINIFWTPYTLYFFWCFHHLFILCSCFLVISSLDTSYFVQYLYSMPHFLHDVSWILSPRYITYADCVWGLSYSDNYDHVSYRAVCCVTVRRIYNHYQGFNIYVTLVYTSIPLQKWNENGSGHMIQYLTGWWK